MTRFIAILAFSVLSLQLAGCASAPLVPDVLPEDVPNAETGYIAGSFSREYNAVHYYSNNFLFRNIASEETYRLESNPPAGGDLFSGYRDDFSSYDYKGAAFLIPLPVGEYEFYNFFLNGGANHFSAREDYSIPFEVLPNAITYLGEVKLVPQRARNTFGIFIPWGGIWVLSDKQERDMQLLLEKFPELDAGAFVKRIPDEERIEAPLVFLPSEEYVPDEDSQE
ncbi:MAG: hypothetical protein P1U64_08245 [Alcanivoracaceae bacterium]|nr:hypothetical protein [Alcanivoracaceae bacterium]